MRTALPRVTVKPCRHERSPASRRTQTRMKFLSSSPARQPTSSPNQLRLRLTSISNVNKQRWGHGSSPTTSRRSYTRLTTVHITRQRLPTQLLAARAKHVGIEPAGMNPQPPATDEQGGITTTEVNALSVDTLASTGGPTGGW